MSNIITYMKLLKELTLFPDIVKPSSYEYFRLIELRESIDRTSLVLVDKNVVLRSMKLKHKGYLSVNIRYSSQIVSIRIARNESRVKIKMINKLETISRTRNYDKKIFRINNLLYLLLAKDNPSFKDIESLHESID